MKIIESSFQIIKPANFVEGVEMLRFIEAMARISHRSETGQTEDSWKRFIQFVVIEKGDLSVVEHAIATVIMTVNRGVSHELVRHRLFSFTQESTRFVRYGDKHPLEFIMPATGYNLTMEDSFYQSEMNYLSLLEQGVRPQEARAVLPNALATRIAVTGNLRNWRHLFLMRTTRESHPDMRGIVIQLLAEFKIRIPLLYDDIEPEARQIDNLSKPR